jgi:hypothetical protein
MCKYMIVGLGLLLGLGAGCSGEQTGTSPGESVYPTVEEAAVEAWEFSDAKQPSEDRRNGPREEAWFDRPATLELLKTKAEKSEVDLNGDGITEVLLANGHFVDKSGEVTSFDGAQNGSWVVLQKVTAGWRVVGSGFGSPCPPYVLGDRTNGWKNLESGHHLSVASGSSHLYQFDGTRYKLTQRIEYDHWPSRATTTPTTEPTPIISPAMSW